MGRTGGPPTPSRPPRLVRRLSWTTDSGAVRSDEAARRAEEAAALIRAARANASGVPDAPESPKGISAAQQRAEEAAALIRAALARAAEMSDAPEASQALLVAQQRAEEAAALIRTLRGGGAVTQHGRCEFFTLDEAFDAGPAEAEGCSPSEAARRAEEAAALIRAARAKAPEGSDAPPALSVALRRVATPHGRTPRGAANIALEEGSSPRLEVAWPGAEGEAAADGARPGGPGTDGGPEEAAAAASPEDSAALESARRSAAEAAFRRAAFEFDALDGLSSRSSSLSPRPQELSPRPEGSEGPEEPAAERRAAEDPGAPAARGRPGIQHWVVVGGGDKGGILVRRAQDLKSAQCPSRLATGAVVIGQADLGSERLHYWLIQGEGPQAGWVSVAFKGKELLRPASPPAEPSGSGHALGSTLAAGPKDGAPAPHSGVYRCMGCDAFIALSGNAINLESRIEVYDRVYDIATFATAGGAVASGLAVAATIDGFYLVRDLPAHFNDMGEWGIRAASCQSCGLCLGWRCERGETAREEAVVYWNLAWRYLRNAPAPPEPGAAGGARVSCPAGHRLWRHRLERGGRTCHGCGQALDAGQVALGCGDCDLDVCAACGGTARPWPQTFMKVSSASPEVARPGRPQSSS